MATEETVVDTLDADRSWGVYLLECSDGTYYCGVTNDIDKRVIAHSSGKGARYTRARLPVSLLVYSGNVFTRSEALKEEYKVKRLPRKNKIKYLKTLL